jgi:biotin carboxylase
VRVHLFRRPSQDNWAKDVVSEFIPVDTTKPDEAYAKALQKLKKSGALNGITTYWEDDVELTAKLAEGLGLKYHPVKTTQIARDKAATRKAMADANLSPVAFKRITSRADIEAAVEDKMFPFPAVLKPAKGAEAQFTGVVNRGDALRVYDESLKGMLESHDTIFNQSHDFVLEEYLGGSEWDANIIVQDGKLLAGSITDNTEIRQDKQTLKEGEQRQINMKSTGAALPSVALTEAQQKEALEFAHKAVLALGGRDGVFHVEGKTANKGPRLLEVNLRPGGAYVVHWNKAVTGIDEAEMLFAIAAGIPAVPFQAQQPLRHLKGIFVFSDRQGVVKRIGLKPQSEEAGIKAIIEKKPGAVIDFKDNDRVAMISASGRTAEEADTKLGEAKDHLDLHIEEAKRAVASQSWFRAWFDVLARLLSGKSK